MSCHVMSAFIYPCRPGRRTWLAASPAPASLLYSGMMGSSQDCVHTRAVLPAAAAFFARASMHARDFLACSRFASAIAIDREQQSDRQPAAYPPQVPFRNRKLRRRPASKADEGPLRAVCSITLSQTLNAFKDKGPLVLPVVSTCSTSTLAQIKGPLVRAERSLRERLIASSQASACVNMVNGRHTVLRGTTPPTRLLLVDFSHRRAHIYFHNMLGPAGYQETHRLGQSNQSMSLTKIVCMCQLVWHHRTNFTNPRCRKSGHAKLYYHIIMGMRHRPCTDLVVSTMVGQALGALLIEVEAMINQELERVWLNCVVLTAEHVQVVRLDHPLPAVSSGRELLEAGQAKRHHRPRTRHFTQVFVAVGNRSGKQE